MSSDAQTESPFAAPTIGGVDAQVVLKLGGMVTPISSALSVVLSVANLIDCEAVDSVSDKQTASLFMESLGLGLWASAIACPPLGIVAAGVSAADLALGMYYFSSSAATSSEDVEGSTVSRT